MLVKGTFVVKHGNYDGNHETTSPGFGFRAVTSGVKHQDIQTSTTDGMRLLGELKTELNA